MIVTRNLYITFSTLSTYVKDTLIIDNNIEKEDQQ